MSLSPELKNGAKLEEEMAKQDQNQGQSSSQVETMKDYEAPPAYSEYPSAPPPPQDEMITRGQINKGDGQSLPSGQIQGQGKDPAQAENLAPSPAPAPGQNPYKGPMQLQSAVICCRTTARTWTILGIFTNMIYLAIILSALTHALTTLQSTPEKDLNNPKKMNDLYDGQFEEQVLGAAWILRQTFLIFLIVITSIAFIFPTLALQSVRKENVRCLTFWIILQFLWVFLSVIRLIFICFVFNATPFLLNYLFLALDIFFLWATVKYRNELVRYKEIRSRGLVIARHQV